MIIKWGSKVRYLFEDRTIDLVQGESGSQQPFDFIAGLYIKNSTKNTQVVCDGFM